MLRKPLKWTQEEQRVRASVPRKSSGFAAVAGVTSGSGRTSGTKGLQEV